MHTLPRSTQYPSSCEVLLGRRRAAFMARNRKTPVAMGFLGAPGPLPKAKRSQFYSGHPSASEKPRHQGEPTLSLCSWLRVGPV